MSAGKGQIEQALEQVRRQPGSPAFATLAEHYLEQGNIDEAFRICRDGFAANPGFERGAVAYLTVLRRMKQTDTAGEVYGRAVAYLPRSSRVRVGWALILADVGKEREARHLAREALDLDPTSAVARALIATLGGTPAPAPAPAWRRTAEAEAEESPAAGEEVIDDPSLLEEEQPPSPPPPRAEVRPWIRPIGQRVTPHAMFDLTPVPMVLDPETRRALRDGDAFFETPSPTVDEEQQLVEEDVTNLDVEVPPDLFDDPYFGEAAAREPAQTATPDRPATEPEELHTEVEHSPAIISSDAVTREQPLTPELREKLTAADSSDFIITEDALDWEPAASPPPSPASPEAPLPPQPMLPPLFPSTAAVPLPRSTPGAHAQGFEGVEEMEEDEEVVPRRRPHLPRWMWLAGGVAVLAGLAVGGFVLARHLQDRSFDNKVGEALTRTLPDHLASYHAARQQLETLVGSRPRDARAAGALALVNAHLWARFSTADALRDRARALLGGTARGSEAAVVAAALLETHGGDARRAAASVAALQVKDTRLRWHAQLVWALAALATGQVAEAEKIFAPVLGAKPPAPALLLEAATLDRRLNRLDHGEQAVELGLMASPGHPGLRIQQALLRAAKGSYAEGEAGIQALEQAATGVARYRASVALLRGLLAVRRGDRAAALRAGQEACRADPTSADAALQLAAWQLGPGGDAAAALALLDRFCASAGACGLDRAWAMLLLARPHEALVVLASVAASEVGPEDRRRLAELRLRAAHLADDDRAVLETCGAKAPPRDDPRLLLTCAEALLDRSRLGPAAVMARHLNDAAATRLISGLRALAVGDTATAIARLEGLPRDPLAQTALARAQVKQGNHAKAITTLRQAVELDAHSTRSRVALATILIAAGHDTEAVTTFDAIVAARPTQPSVLAAVGEGFLTVGQPGRAASLLQQAMKHTAGSVAVQLLAGRVALANRRNAEARSRFSDVLRREPRNAEALVELGRLDAAEGHAARARQRFAAALKQRPKDPELLLLLARGHAQTGDYRKAVASGMQAIKLLRQSGQTGRAYEVMVELGRLVARGDRWAKARAEELFFEATKPQNSPAAPFFELGRLHKQKGDVARAVWCFRQATERDPQLAEAYLEMGLAMRAKPQWRKEAKKALRHYLKLRPQAKDAARIKAMVDRMR